MGGVGVVGAVGAVGAVGVMGMTNDECPRHTLLSQTSPKGD